MRGLPLAECQDVRVSYNGLALPDTDPDMLARLTEMVPAGSSSGS
jgi:hypothetical protein